MKLFAKLNSAKLSKRLEELKAQLAAADAAVEDRQAVLEQALADEKPSEKPLSDLALSRTRSEALRSVIGKAEVALAEVQAAEEEKRQWDWLLAQQKRAAGIFADLEKKKARLLEIQRQLGAATADFDSSGRELQEMVAAFDLSQAVGGLIPRGADYLRSEMEANSNLGSVRTRLEAKFPKPGEVNELLLAGGR